MRYGGSGTEKEQLTVVAGRESLIRRAETEHRLNEVQLAALLSDPEAEEELAAAADRVRSRTVGDAVHLRGLIEFSSYCRRNCFYCGLRRDNAQAGRFRLAPEEIVALARQGKAYGYQTLVLQSGEDPWFTAERLTPILREIKHLDVAITLSVGERSFADYQALKEAGADRFLLRIETTDRAVYEALDPGMSFDERRRCLADLRQLGYEVGTGCLVGLPGQTVASLARDVLFFQKIDADMIGIGPLVPNDDTPLKGTPPGDMGLVRRLVALIRLLLPEANIPATTAMETLAPGSRDIILRSGANVVMPNLTMGKARQLYALYPGKADVADTPEGYRERLADRIRALGRFIGQDAGARRRSGAFS